VDLFMIHDENTQEPYLK